MDSLPPENTTDAPSDLGAGEPVPNALIGFVDFSLEHLGRIGGWQPPERAGVDTRFAALFERHVLRC